MHQISLVKYLVMMVLMVVCKKMPDKDIKPKVQAQVLAHLKDRANGMPSIVGDMLII